MTNADISISCEHKLRSTSDLSIVSFYQYFIYIAFIRFPWLFYDTNFRVQLVAEREFKKTFEIYRTVKYVSYLTQGN